MPTSKLIYYFIITQSILLATKLSAKEHENTNKDEIVLISTPLPTVKAHTSYIECNNFSYSMGAEFVVKRFYRPMLEYELSAKVYTISKGKKRYINDASNLIMQHFELVKSSGGICWNPDKDEMRLIVHGRSKLTEEEEDLDIILSKNEIVSYEIFKEPEADK